MPVVQLFFSFAFVIVSNHIVTCIIQGMERLLVNPLLVIESLTATLADVYLK